MNAEWIIDLLDAAPFKPLRLFFSDRQGDAIAVGDAESARLHDDGDTLILTSRPAS